MPLPCTCKHTQERWTIGSHRRAATVKGSKLSYTTVAMKCEPIVYSSLLTPAGVVLAGPEPMLTRLVRGGIALAVTASVPADPSSRRLADPVEGGELS